MSRYYKKCMNCNIPMLKTDVHNQCGDFCNEQCMDNYYLELNKLIKTHTFTEKQAIEALKELRLKQ